MGTYLNPDTRNFEMTAASEVFVDKTGMIAHLNAALNTSQRYVCVSRPRRFGKSTAADMLCAYYVGNASHRALFEQKDIARKTSELLESHKMPWDVYLGKYNVVRLVMTDHIKAHVSVEKSLSRMQRLVSRDIVRAFPEVDYFDTNDLPQTMADVYAERGCQFVIVIDEWDAVFRERKHDRRGQSLYLDFLRDWLKDKEYVALVYMTGILPIKKYGKHSALNMFWEYSMTQPQQFAPYMGFTASEVMAECSKRGLDYAGFKDWYDGYRLAYDTSPEMVARESPAYEDAVREAPAHKAANLASLGQAYEVFCPFSVVKAIVSKKFDNYWNQTESYEALREYIDWNFDGLKEDVAVLLDGGRVAIDVRGYQNDMTTFEKKDDILTMFIHLGYLGYDGATSEVFVPNREIRQVFAESTSADDWSATLKALQNSKALLDATWALDADTVARLIEAAHDEAGNRTYNSEAALSYAVQLAYYRARDYYTVVPEFDSGKGYVDLAYLPRIPSIPALLVELKYEKSAQTAIDQIHRQKYPQRLSPYQGNMILVGINYDKDVANESVRFKHHSCLLERA